MNDDTIRAKEQATYKLAAIYKEKGLVEELINLTKIVLPLFLDFPKSKLAKITRTLFDLAMKVEGRHQQLVELCEHIIAWCEKENRSFLRMRIETNLADLNFKLQKYNAAAAAAAVVFLYSNHEDPRDQCCQVFLVRWNQN